MNIIIPTKYNIHLNCEKCDRNIKLPEDTIFRCLEKAKLYGDFEYIEPYNSSTPTCELLGILSRSKWVCRPCCGPERSEA